MVALTHPAHGVFNKIYTRKDVTKPKNSNYYTASSLLVNTFQTLFLNLSIMVFVAQRAFNWRNSSVNEDFAALCILGFLILNALPIWYSEFCFYSFPINHVWLTTLSSAMGVFVGWWSKQFRSRSVINVMLAVAGVCFSLFLLAFFEDSVLVGAKMSGIQKFMVRFNIFILAYMIFEICLTVLSYTRFGRGLRLSFFVRLDSRSIYQLLNNMSFWWTVITIPVTALCIYFDVLRVVHDGSTEDAMGNTVMLRENSHVMMAYLLLVRIVNLFIKLMKIFGEIDDPDQKKKRGYYSMY